MRTKAAVTAVARRCLSVSEGTAAGRRGHATQGKKSFVDARRWAQKQPGLAREVLAVPPPPLGPQSVNAPPSSAPPASSLESYLKLRQWDMTMVSPEDRGVAMSLISHPLTFPLTLGTHMSTLLNTCSAKHRPTITGSRNRSRSSTLRLCCVGARAEATLPDEYWKELLLSASLSGGFQTMNEDVEASTSTTCSIDFIGPDVSPHLQSKTIVLDVPWAIKHTLEMNFHKYYLHQYIAERYKVSKNSVSAAAKDRSAALHDRSFDPASQLSLWDGYVLFNPGIGHPNLAKGWIPTLRYVINTRRPVLITAHSRLDSERDWSVLKATLLDLGQDERLQRCCGHSDDDGEQNPYRLNPFASRLDYEDPFCSEAGLHLGNGKEDGSNYMYMYVRPNMFSLLLH